MCYLDAVLSHKPSQNHCSHFSIRWFCLCSFLCRWVRCGFLFVYSFLWMWLMKSAQRGLARLSSRKKYQHVSCPHWQHSHSQFLYLFLLCLFTESIFNAYWHVNEIRYNNKIYRLIHNGRVPNSLEICIWIV